MAAARIFIQNAREENIGLLSACCILSACVCVSERVREKESESINRSSMFTGRLYLWLTHQRDPLLQLCLYPSHKHI